MLLFKKVMWKISGVIRDSLDDFSLFVLGFCVGIKMMILCSYILCRFELY